MPQKFTLRNVEINNIKVVWKEDIVNGGAHPIITASFTMPDMPMRLQQELASQYVAKHSANVTVELLQPSMIGDFDPETGEVFDDRAS